MNYEVLNKLKLSKFRSSFKLKDKDINYIKKNGMDKIKEQEIADYQNSLSENAE